MRNKYKSIICSLLLCSTLSNICAASDYLDTYTPSTSSKVGLFKAALIGIGLMSMAKPVEAITGFRGCYLGTIDPQDAPNMEYIRVKTIKPAPCNFYYNTTPSQFTPIDMTMKASCSDEDCFNVHINSINLCSRNYTGTSTSKLTWDYLKTGQYEKFALSVVAFSLSDINTHTTFDLLFPKYMNTGKCN